MNIIKKNDYELKNSNMIIIFYEMGTRKPRKKEIVTVDDLDGENWKYTNVNDEYKVSNSGRIRQDHGKIMTQRKGHNSMIVVLIKNKMRYTFQVKLLVAKAFLDNPNNYTFVKNKDGDFQNNNVNNLEWISDTEFYKNKETVRMNTMNKAIIEDLDGEKWKIIDDYGELYQISNRGRIKNVEYGTLFNTQKHKIQLKFDGSKKSYKIRDLVAHYFLDKVDGKDYVRNIDGNKFNNDVNNLEWVELKCMVDSYIEGEIWTEINKSDRKYFVSNHGRVTSNETGGIFTSPRVHLIVSNNTKHMSPLLKHLVAEYFLPKVEGKTEVNNKDGDENNNHVDNLEWVEKYIIDDLEHEEWKVIGGYHNKYQISNYGRLKNANSCKLLKSIEEYGLVIHALKKNGKVKYPQVKNLVALYFLEKMEGKMYVKNKDGDRNNNRVDNLEWIDREEYNAINAVNKKIRNNVVAAPDLEGEIWKEVEGFNGKYKLSNMARIKNTQSEFISNPNHKNQYGFMIISLFKNSYSYKYQLHRMVADYFLPNPLDKEYVMHIDGNKMNNKSSNLKWVDRYEIGHIHCHGPISHVITNDYSNIYDNEFELWLPIKNYNKYQISQLGNVKSKFSGKLLSKQMNGQYYSVYLRNEHGTKIFMIHRLVATHFIVNNNPIENIVIDHIDENKLNNTCENLRWVTHSENAQFYHNNHKYEHSENILQLDKEGNLIKEWNGVSEIEIILKYKGPHIYQAIKNNKLAYDYLWEYKNKIVRNVTYYDDEIFKNCGIIDGYDLSNYEASNYGKVKSLFTGKIMELQFKNHYYRIIFTSNDGMKRVFEIHRIVAYLFVDNYYPLINTIVNHLDENKLNNHYKNLEWTTMQGNAEYSLAKKVQQIDMETNNTINIYDSITKACEDLNITREGQNCGIIRCCKGTQHKAYGYKWKYLDE